MANLLERQDSREAFGSSFDLEEYRRNEGVFEPEDCADTPEDLDDYEDSE